MELRERKKRRNLNVFKPFKMGTCSQQYVKILLQLPNLSNVITVYEALGYNSAGWAQSKQKRGSSFLNLFLSNQGSMDKLCCTRKQQNVITNLDCSVGAAFLMVSHIRIIYRKSLIHHLKIQCCEERYTQAKVRKWDKN